MYEESAISIFRRLPETKGQVKKYASLIKESVLAGDVDPLLFATHVNVLEQLFKALKDDALIKDVILEEAEKYGLKSFEHGNGNFRIQEVGVKYNFTTCMDSEWETLKSEQKQINDRLKEREAFLKTLKPGMEVFGTDGIQLEVPGKTSTTSVIITLK